MNNVILESERLYLKEFTQDDVNDYYRLNSDADVMKFIRPPETDIKVIEKSIKKIRMYYKDHPGLGVWACFERESNDFVGFFELAHLDNTEEIEVGYRLHKKFWGKGHATEMSKVLIDYGFNKIGLEKIAGIAHPDHIASQNVLLKCGLKYVKDAVFYGFLDKYYLIENKQEENQT